ncbi:hypothetical protein EXW96_26385 [Paenibacillus sp. JMULE4]|uniref:hypothetical protein n=1 Tax=Paenibacillus sp. JMULE4 TaxID=2518342 RepID=UPI0015768626|nr:hypothetical protein [Paenibacillus sp. JMULE4]NTZ20918.1 hypothetical protein [Paenibacillus sp. JMULE4]
MNPIVKRKIRQRMQSCTDQQFWNDMNWIHTRAYEKGVSHMREAMECIPGITKKQVEAVLAKAVEIREQWDGMREVEVESSLDQLLERKE